MAEVPHKPRGSRDGDAAGRLIHVASEEQQLALPGTLWPAGCDRGQGNPIFFSEITLDQANELIEAFGHPLGPFNRSFGYQAWALAVDGKAAAVAVSGSTVGATSAGYKRAQVVDLARIARHPGHPGILRVMLRLWRDYLAGRWDYWPVQAAVSYALPGREGNLYRFDGWTFYGYCKPWAGGGTWSKPSKANEMADGVKKLYCYRYPPAAYLIAELLSAAGFDLGRKSKKRRTPGFIVTSPSPGAVRVRYHSTSRASAALNDEMLGAYAAAINAAGYAATADPGGLELAVTPRCPLNRARGEGSQR
jgi:hypothetical protein